MNLKNARIYLKRQLDLHPGDSSVGCEFIYLCPPQRPLTLPGPGPFWSCVFRPARLRDRLRFWWLQLTRRVTELQTGLWVEL